MNQAMNPTMNSATSQSLSDPNGSPKEGEAWFESHLVEYLRDLEELVSIPSIGSSPEDGCPFGPACHKALETGRRILGKYGLTADLDGAGGFLTCQASPAREKNLGIFSHLDVVPIGDVGDWKYRPFRVSLREGFLIGRGVGDNKGPALLILYVLRYLKEKQIDLNYGIQLFWGTNEESGMADLSAYLQQHPQPQIAFTPDADFPVCIGEKSIIEAELQYDFKSSNLLDLASGEVANSIADWAEAKLQLTDRGTLDGLAVPEHMTLTWDEPQVLRVRAKGKSSHAAFPEGSVNAVVELAKFLLTTPWCDEKARGLMKGLVALLEDYYGGGMNIAYNFDVFGPLTAAGGFSTSRDQIYKQNLNIRMSPEITVEEVLSGLKSAGEAYGFSASLIKSSAGFYLSPDTPWIQAMLDAIRDGLGSHRQPVGYVMGGATYSRMLKHCVGFGPGNKAIQKPADLGNGHQPDECIALQALKDAFGVYTNYFTALNDLDNWKG